MPAPANVLFLHSSSGRYGADRQLLALAAGLDRSRYAPLVILPAEGELAGDLRGAGVQTLIRPIAVLRRGLFTPGGLLQVAGRAAADAVGLRHLIRSHGISLVHSNTSVILSGTTAARSARIPHVVSVREIYVDFARFWRYYRRFLLTADALSCDSAATATQFGSHPRVRVMHEAVTVYGRAERSAARRALGLPEDAFVSVVLGRLSSWKGQEVLARALAEEGLARGDVIGLVAGDAWPGQERYERDLQALADRLDLDQRFRLLGFREDTATLYGAADVVVVPSTRPEPLGNVALEAAASGCCVVASGHGGLTEIIRDGQTGRLFGPGNHVELARVLEELRADPDQRARLGSGAAADVPERFSLRRLLDSTQQLYDELLTRDPRGAARA